MTPRGDSDWTRLRPASNEDPEDSETSPSPRPRALTPPLPETSESSVQKLPQDQPPLFERLPAELRLLIWEHYLCDQKLHLVLTNQDTWKQSHSKKIIGLACSERRDYCACNHQCWGQFTRRPAGGCVEAVRHVDSQWPEEQVWKFNTGRVNFVPLLQTCRMIYSEAIDMLYQNNTFLFNHTATFVDFSQTLLPQRLGLIRTVQLSLSDTGGSTWEKCCHALATKMPNLRNLTIHIHPLVTKSFDIWLKPLNQIQQTAVFEVRLIIPRTWYVDPRWQKSPCLVDAPFQFALADTKQRCLIFADGHGPAE